MSATNGTIPLNQTNLNEKSAPLPVITIIVIWLAIVFLYIITKWRQRSKANYIIPRVFVLCSPRTVQYHYEMILRVGMPSADYNPDKHDIDVTVLGGQRNEVVPMTRLNTKTLQDEPLITSLSMIVHRLVEMPQLGSLILRHSGSFKSWVYVYDFTVIDLSNNREVYFTINKYIGSLNRVYTLEEHKENQGVYYPIDDVPLPPWLIEDIFLIVYAGVNCIVLSLSLMPLSCGVAFATDIGSITLASLNAGSVIFFLEWLLYYYARWNSDRKEYFNLNGDTSGWLSRESWIRMATALLATIIGGLAIYYALSIKSGHDALVWALCTSNTCIIAIGTWNVARQAELCESISAMGLRFRGIETVGVGMRPSEIVSDIQTKSGSASDDEPNSTLSSAASKLARSFGPRSSVKSFGFDPVTGNPSRISLSKLARPSAQSSSAAVGGAGGAVVQASGEGQREQSRVKNKH